MNVERAQDVLMHKRLPQLATESSNRPAFDVRIVQVKYAQPEIDNLPFSSSDWLVASYGGGRRPKGIVIS